MFVSLLAVCLPEECERNNRPSHQLDLDLDAIATYKLRFMYKIMYIQISNINGVYPNIKHYCNVQSHRPSFKMHPLCTSQNFTG